MSDRKYSFLNRDLSWLSFNHRVLLEAKDESVPLYSRIQFLSIFSSNLDEFFRVRMPSIYAFSSVHVKKKSFRDEYPEDLVQNVRLTIQGQLEEFGKILTMQILPALEANRIHLYYGDDAKEEHKETISEYFLSRVLSFLQPVILSLKNQAGIFLENNHLYFILDIENATEGTHDFALVNIPSDELPRFLELAPIDGVDYVVFLDDIIRENLRDIFPGFVVHGAYSIKLTRNAELNIEDELTGDIAEKIEKQLDKRDAGNATRLLYDGAMPPHVCAFVQNYFGLRAEEMVEGGRYHNLKDLGSLPNPAGKKLLYENWPSIPHPGFNNRQSMFKIVAEKERLLHLPYHSYNYILRFFNEAAIDPQVKDINITLYRIAANSHIANALISAAKNGKRVTVFVELKARFDEANNLRWAKKMKAAGIKIINSIPGLKVHAKIALVARLEEKQLRYYSLLATGNFNESTGRFYTDHVMLTARECYSQELQHLFIYLQSRLQPKEFGKISFDHLLVSQFNMMKRLDKMIDREIKHAKAGKNARITVKVNNLQERHLIAKLYEASRAGVEVRLLVRSICCVAPAVAGQSENIQIRRIVDRYLEHARIFKFDNNGQPEYYMGSADWMNRNLHSRIEVVFPLYDDTLKHEIDQILQMQWEDCKKGVIFDMNYSNLKIDAEKSDSQPAQERIYRFVKELKG